MPIGIPKVPFQQPGEPTAQWVELYNELYCERVLYLEGVGTKKDEGCFSPQVAFYMSLFYKRHPVALLYVGLVGLFRTAAEGHALLMLLTHPDMTAGEAFSSFICSHLMTPAMNAALAILQVIPKVTPDVNLRCVSMGVQCPANIWSIDCKFVLTS